MGRLAVAVYTSNVAAGATDADIAALIDPQFTITNNHILMPMDSKLELAYVFGASVIRAQMVTPKFRSVVIPFVRPIERAATPPQLPNVSRMGGYWPIIPTNEELQFLVSNNLGAATEQENVVVWLSDGRNDTPVGPVYPLRFTSTITLVANAFASGSITLAQTLPSGRYAIVGASGFCTNGAIARFILPGYQWRPGFLVGQNAGIFMGEWFQAGSLGNWGEFVNTSVPSVEVFGTANGAQTLDGYMYIIKIG